MLIKLRDHLEKLNHFLSIARCGSFRKAAETLHITQPTLSYSIKILEDVIGQSLFRRTPQGVTLTKSGTILLEFCERYFAELDDIESKIRAPESEFAGALRIGTYESLAVHFWPRFLRSFSSRFPDVTLSFKVGISSNLKEMLIDHELDVVVAVEIQAHHTLKNIELFDDQYSFYLSPLSRFAWQTTGHVADSFSLSTSQFPVIYVPFARSTDTITLQNHLTHQGFTSTNLRYELESFEAVREFTLAGIGVGVLPIRLAAAAVDEGKLIKIQMQGFNPEGFGLHRIMACLRAEDHERPILERLIADLANDQGKSMF